MAYRRYVERGPTAAPENPFRAAGDGWLLGSLDFVDKIRTWVGQAGHHDEVPVARQLSAIELVRIRSAVVRAVKVIGASWTGHRRLMRRQFRGCCPELEPVTVAMAPTAGVATHGHRPRD